MAGGGAAAGCCKFAVGTGLVGTGWVGTLGLTPLWTGGGKYPRG